MNKSWIYVILTCLFELIWVFGFNTAETWWHWGLVIVFIFFDFYTLPKACEAIPTGTVYAIFAGVGTVGTAIMDVFLFEGDFSVGKVLFMALLIAGIIGLKLADNKEVDKNMKGVA